VTRVNVADLVSVHEIGARAGVSTQAVHNWAARHHAFPRPIATFGTGPRAMDVWHWPDVAAWLDTTGRTRGGE
jgi:hypothetical protein